MLNTYLDGLYEGDTEKLGRAFHDCADLFSSGAGAIPPRYFR